MGLFDCSECGSVNFLIWDLGCSHGLVLFLRRRLHLYYFKELRKGAKTSDLWTSDRWGQISGGAGMNGTSYVNGNWFQWGVSPVRVIDINGYQWLLMGYLYVYIYYYILWLSIYNYPHVCIYDLCVYIYPIFLGAWWCGKTKCHLLTLWGSQRDPGHSMTIWKSMELELEIRHMDPYGHMYVTLCTLWKINIDPGR